MARGQNIVCWIILLGSWKPNANLIDNQSIFIVSRIMKSSKHGTRNKTEPWEQAEGSLRMIRAMSLTFSQELHCVPWGTGQMSVFSGTSCWAWVSLGDTIPQPLSYTVRSMLWRATACNSETLPPKAGGDLPKHGSWQNIRQKHDR